MSTMHRRTLSMIFALASASLVTVAHAQPSGPGPGGPGRGPGYGMGPGAMMGPGMMGRGMYGRMCSPAAAGFAEWRIDRLERAIQPTEAQRAKFDEFKAASSKAAETMRAACPAETPLTVTGRMEAMEKRMDVMLQAIKAVRPALDAFYATLSEEQKARLNSTTGPHRFWRWRDRR